MVSAGAVLLENRMGFVIQWKKCRAWRMETVNEIIQRVRLPVEEINIKVANNTCIFYSRTTDYPGADPPSDQ